VCSMVKRKRYATEKAHLPGQYTGKSVDYHSTLDLDPLTEANTLFVKIRMRLLQFNRWHRITDGPSDEFYVGDERGNPVEKTVEQGDRIRVDVPGPGLPSSQGYDWVQVEDIAEEQHEDSKRMLISLRPCPDPTNDKDDTAHFFKALATSSFLLEQKRNTILLHYAGRNEVINTENESNWDNIRNFLVGLGAKMGASYPQWKALVDGLAQVR